MVDCALAGRAVDGYEEEGESSEVRGVRWLAECRTAPTATGRAVVLKTEELELA